MIECISVVVFSFLFFHLFDGKEYFSSTRILQKDAVGYTTRRDVAPTSTAVDIGTVERSTENVVSPGLLVTLAPESRSAPPTGVTRSRRPRAEDGGERRRGLKEGRNEGLSRRKDKTPGKEEEKRGRGGRSRSRREEEEPGILRRGYKEV